MFNEKLVYSMFQDENELLNVDLSTGKIDSIKNDLQNYINFNNVMYNLFINEELDRNDVRSIVINHDYNVVILSSKYMVILLYMIKDIYKGPFTTSKIYNEYECSFQMIKKLLDENIPSFPDNNSSSIDTYANNIKRTFWQALQRELIKCPYLPPDRYVDGYYTVYKNSDSSENNNLDKLDPNDGTLDNCKLKCDIDDNCLGFVHKTTNNECWLKKNSINITSTKPRPNLNVYVKNRIISPPTDDKPMPPTIGKPKPPYDKPKPPAPLPRDNYIRYSNVTSKQENLYDITDVNNKGYAPFCKEECNKKSECIGFEYRYNKNNGKCWFKKHSDERKEIKRDTDSDFYQKITRNHLSSNTYFVHLNKKSQGSDLLKVLQASDMGGPKACKVLCKNHSGCHGFEYSSTENNGTCWLKSQFKDPPTSKRNSDLYELNQQISK